MIATFSRWGLLGIAMMYALEAIVPIPIEIPFWLSGQMLQQGAPRYWQLVLVTWLGTSVGNVLAFAVARMGGRPLLMKLMDWLHIQDEVSRLQRWIDRYGLGVVAMTRWINWGFGLSVWLTGFSRIPSWQALIVMLINNAFWSVAWVGLARIIVGALYLASLPNWLVLVPGVVLLTMWGMLRMWRNQRTSKLRDH